MRSLGWLVFALLGATPLRAEAQDGDELVRLQRVLQRAAARVAPSVVRVETFGGTRRMLAPDLAAADGAPQKPVPMPPQRSLDELWRKLDPEERKELFERPGVDPEDLGAKDLRKLDPDTLKKLFEQHDLEWPAPPEPGEQPDRGVGPLVMPGFLQAQGATTGLVLGADGWILVSRFALNFDPTTILVTLADGRTFTAARAGEDTSRGIALVKIEAEGLPVPELVDPDRARVGQWAFALGRTFGTGSPSVHMGIVSATERLFGRALQIDAYTSPANYGGPVIDLKGRVLGVAVPLSPSGRDVGVDWYDSGIGFATTLADIPELLERMKTGEVLHRGWLGIQTQPAHDGPGARLAGIAADSPAKGIGLEKDDVLVAVDEVPVRNSFHLQMLISSKMAGEPVHLKYRRGDEPPVGVTVFLGEVPQAEREARTKKEETFTLPWEEGDPEERGR